jgi:hypothetical protein
MERKKSPPTSKTPTRTIPTAVGNCSDLCQTCGCQRFKPHPVAEWVNSDTLGPLASMALNATAVPARNRTSTSTTPTASPVECEDLCHECECYKHMPSAPPMAQGIRKKRRRSKKRKS